MNRRPYFLVGIALLAIAGCDPVYKIPVESTYTYDVSVTIYYSDGKLEKTIWPACGSRMIGRFNVDIEKIVIEKDNHILLTLSSMDLNAVEEKFNQVPVHESPAMVIFGPTGVEAGGVKPDREAACVEAAAQTKKKM